MQIKKEVSGDVDILRLSGRILIGEGDEMIREFIERLMLEGRVKIILDMKEVLYSDASGYGEIVRMYTSLHRSGGDLKLLNLSDRAKNFLAITKLLTVFEIFDDEKEAINSFKS